MKKIILTLGFCALTLFVRSQNASVEQSTFGIQTGFAGFWIYNELKLSNQIALRSELGFDARNGKSDFYPDTGFLLTTVVILEPRWYYNLFKRESKSKRIDGNSGNFFSLKTSLHHSDLLISLDNDEDTKIVTDLSIIPTWGIRRNIGKHFNYEAGVGVGYIHYFSKNAGFSKDKGEAAINLHLRVGYRF
ncbi:hypothetical protein [Aquimarina megaterium]|uniref:hypothetical protein n=1 Tax=Aquimarina megaterium TaxID=1443666 RepID=UPI0009445ECC|nr:hypothetical protein [Aquimarina megaterium]